MKPTITLTIALTLLIVLGLGCGMGKPSIPKEQMDKDIASQVVDVQEGREKKWVFAADDQRCFNVVDAESKSTDSTADMMVTVASFQEITSNDTLTVFGKMLMKYRKDGDKWVLDRIEPKDLMSKELEMKEFEKWVDLQVPLCKYSRFVK